MLYRTGIDSGASKRVMRLSGPISTWRPNPTYRVTADVFGSQFGRDLDALQDRMYFVDTEAGQTVASITAWWETENRPSERGRIHWVVVLPEHQRRGSGQGNDDKGHAAAVNQPSAGNARDVVRPAMGNQALPGLWILSGPRGTRSAEDP